MTSRERTVALLIAQGLTDYAIAERLELSLGATKVCRQRIQRRLQLANRSEIAAWVTARTSDAGPDRLRRVGDRIGMKTDGAPTDTGPGPPMSGDRATSATSADAANSSDTSSDDRADHVHGGSADATVLR